MSNRSVGVSSASLPNSQFGDSREDSLSYVIIIVIYFIIHIMSLMVLNSVLVLFGPIKLCKMGHFNHKMIGAFFISNVVLTPKNCCNPLGAF